MAEYMKGVGSVLMLIALAQLLIPEGGTKKFASLAMGFMIITAVTAPIGSFIEGFEFDAQSFEISEQSLEKAKAQHRAEVIEKHKENLTAKINKKIKHGSRVLVEVANDASLTRVTILLKGDESEAVSYIIRELGLKREEITLKHENN